MKTVSIAVSALLATVSLAAWSQSGPDAAFREHLAAERARIAAERTQVEARHAEAERNCYRRFAVNDCLNEVRAARRTALADLRRQDILLNDEERRRKAGEALQRLERPTP